MKNQPAQQPSKSRKALQQSSNILIVGILFAGIFFMLPELLTTSYTSDGPATVVTPIATTTEEVSNGIQYIETPEPLYGIYMTQCVVGTPSFREQLEELIDTTPLNAVVIDIKDYSGTIGFRTKDPRLEAASLEGCGSIAMKEYIEHLHSKGIYTIARLTVFQDPFYTSLFPEEAVQSVSREGEPWEDNKGLAFVDVSSENFWEYIVAISKEARELGFDEINYDYVRYPSDGPMADASFVNPNRAEAVEIFFKYLHEQVKPTGVVMSADLFGYTTVLKDDLGIGQQLERALPYFDYIMPMVYPSHYNAGFAGLTNPNDDPYLVINRSMEAAVHRALSDETSIRTLDGKPIFEDEIVPAYTTEAGEFIATTTKKVATGLFTKDVHDKLALRPWLQDFDYGKDYTEEDVDAQIRGTLDSDLTSWIFWDPANRYDALRTYFASSTTEEAI